MKHAVRYALAVTLAGALSVACQLIAGLEEPKGHPDGGGDEFATGGNIGLERGFGPIGPDPTQDLAWHFDDIVIRRKPDAG